MDYCKGVLIVRWLGVDLSVCYLWGFERWRLGWGGGVRGEWRWVRVGCRDPF